MAECVSQHECGTYGGRDGRTIGKFAMLLSAQCAWEAVLVQVLEELRKYGTHDLDRWSKLAKRSNLFTIRSAHARAMDGS